MTEIIFDNIENKKLYEGDALALAQSFHPGEKILISSPDEEKSEDTGEALDAETYECRFDAGQVTVSCGKEVQKQEFAVDAPGREKRHAFKRCLYLALSGKTWKKLPWGCLTGVRPVGLVSKMLSSGQSPKEAGERFSEEYFVSKGKRELAIEVALRQKELLRTVDADGYSLYVGIPFCPTTCMYCSFTSYPIGAFGGTVDKYLDALKEEMRECAKIFDVPPTSIYIGGGTPSALSPSQIDALLAAIDENFSLKKAAEVTFEAGRPDTITEEKLGIVKSYGIDRISVNPQTMNDMTLEAIGRRHTSEQVKKAFELARKMGFENINMDIILGLPEEGLYELERTMTALSLMKPDAITVHSLAIKRASRINEMLIEKNAERLPEGVAANMNQLCRLYVSEMGMSPYYLYRQKQIADNFENVGYAKEGKFCLYNVITMEETQSVLALGAGAISKRVFSDPQRPGYIERCANVKEITAYIDRIDEMISRKRELFQ